MREPEPQEGRTVVLVLAPFGVLALLGVWFVANCTDSWCEAAPWEMLKLFVPLFLVVAATYAVLRRNGVRASAAGGAAWLAGITGLALLFAWAQLYEGDYFSAAVGLVIAAISAAIGYRLSRAGRGHSRSSNP